MSQKLIDPSNQLAQNDWLTSHKRGGYSCRDSAAQLTAASGTRTGLTSPARAILNQTLCHREPHLKPCVAGFRAHLNIASVLLHDTPNRVKAEASAFANSLGGKERFEDMRLYLGRNSRSVVGDFNYHTVVFAIRSDSKPALASHSIDGVVDDIRPNLIEFASK